MVGEERSADADPKALGSLLGTTASHQGCLQRSARVEEGSTVTLKSRVNMLQLPDQYVYWGKILGAKVFQNIKRESQI